MLSNDEIQKIIDDIESGAYDIVDVLESIASAAKGEDVRAALYASVYATKNAQINGQPKIVTLAENMTNKDLKYLYLGDETGYDYGYVYAYVDDTLTKLNLYGEGYSPTVTVTPTTTGARVTVTDGHGTTTADIENGTATDAQVETYVEEWLDEHPEATTTVQDESITEEKLSPILLAKVNNVGISADVKEALLDCLAHIAWIDAHGQDYYDALEAALYPPNNLVSISAIFSPGSATIYNTDTLDDLKQYLTVTALYDDLTTEEVSNYVLTGSMATGTKTITVTYAGKTTSFTVTVAEWVTDISAVYTQSQTIYDTANLNDLKSDLVVTATYADSSTGIIASADYTLSGTLTVGTSTITVTYYGKTDTFTVTVSKGLDYTEDALTNVTWTSGNYTVGGGEEVADTDWYRTDKFTVQDLTYSISKTNSNITIFKLFMWDENDVFLGHKEGSDARFQLKPEYKYAVAIKNTVSFDTTGITMLPVDRRSTDVNMFEIDLASMASSVVKVNGYYELNVNSAMSAVGINSSNYDNKINRQSIVGMVNQAVNTSNFPFKAPIRIGTFNYGTNMLLSIFVEGISVSDANLSTLQNYLVENNIKIKYNY